MLKEKNEIFWSNIFEKHKEEIVDAILEYSPNESSNVETIKAVQDPKHNIGNSQKITPENTQNTEYVSTNSTNSTIIHKPTSQRSFSSVDNMKQRVDPLISHHNNLQMNAYDSIKPKNLSEKEIKSSQVQQNSNSYLIERSQPIKPEESKQSINSSSSSIKSNSVKYPIPESNSNNHKKLSKIPNPPVESAIISDKTSENMSDVSYDSTDSELND